MYEPASSRTTTISSSAQARLQSGRIPVRQHSSEMIVVGLCLFPHSAMLSIGLEPSSRDSPTITRRRLDLEIMSRSPHSGFEDVRSSVRWRSGGGGVEKGAISGARRECFLIHEREQAWPSAGSTLVCPACRASVVVVSSLGTPEIPTCHQPMRLGPPVACHEVRPRSPDYSPR